MKTCSRLSMATRPFCNRRRSAIAKPPSWHQLQRRPAAVSRHEHESRPEGRTSRGHRHRGGRPGRPPGSRWGAGGRPGRDRAHQGVGTAVRAVPLASRSSSSSRRSSAMLTEVSVGVRVAGRDRSVGVLLDQRQRRFAGHATYGFRVLWAKASLETSERQTVRQSPTAGEALFGARVLCVFAYWRGARIGIPEGVGPCQGDVGVGPGGLWWWGPVCGARRRRSRGQGWL
jgi:hypothetical protein